MFKQMYLLYNEPTSILNKQVYKNTQIIRISLFNINPKLGDLIMNLIKIIF